MKFVSIKSKLVLAVNKLLFVVIGLLLITVLSTSYFQYKQVTKILISDSEKNLIANGILLVNNNAIALKGMITENAFGDVKELVSSSVGLNKNIIYGIYMDNRLQPWVNAIDSDSSTSHKKMSDSTSLWASKVTSGSFKEIRLNGKRVFEFAAPVIDGEERLGTIRYGASTNNLVNLISALKNQAANRFFRLIIVIVGTTILIFYFSKISINRQAVKIINPLLELSKIVDNISSREYDHEINIKSDDEVGLLAENIESMRKTISDYTENLEKKVEDRTAKIKSMQKQMVEKAHKAGMADVATETLHNVGNILTSVKTSSQILTDIMRNPQYDGLKEANSLLRKNIDIIESFITDDPKGKKLMNYYLLLEEGFKNEVDVVNSHLSRLEEKIELIAEVIAAQQSYTSADGMNEHYNVCDIIDDALTMQMGSIERYNIKIIREYDDVPEVNLQKTKFIHVIINLINNAKDAMRDQSDNRNITIKVFSENEMVFVKFIDTGSGIAKDNLGKIFSHGFTTKDTGHGFGLHSSANYMTEMNGTLTAASDGPRLGAQFTVGLKI